MNATKETKEKKHTEHIIVKVEGRTGARGGSNHGNRRLCTLCKIWWSQLCFQWLWGGETRVFSCGPVPTHMMCQVQCCPGCSDEKRFQIMLMCCLVGEVGDLGPNQVKSNVSNRGYSVMSPSPRHWSTSSEDAKHRGFVVALVNLFKKIFCFLIVRMGEHLNSD